MPRPVCVPCKRFFRPKTNGLPFIEGMPDGASAPAGTEAPERWRPYKLWVGDLMECRGCGAQIISGFANRPVAEHFEPAFAENVERYAPELQVNDC